MILLERPIAKVASHVKQTTKSSMELCRKLWAKTVRCPYVYDKYVLKGSSSKDYYSTPGPACVCLEVAIRRHQCMGWRTISGEWPSCKQHHAQEIYQTCIRKPGTSRIIVNWFIVERRSTTLYGLVTRHPDDHTVHEEWDLKHSMTQRLHHQSTSRQLISTRNQWTALKGLHIIECA